MSTPSKPSIFTVCPALTTRDKAVAVQAVTSLNKLLSHAQFNGADEKVCKDLANQIGLVTYLADCMQVDDPIRIHYKPRSAM